MNEIQSNRRQFLRRSLQTSAAATLTFPYIAKGATPKIKIGQIGTAHSHASGKMATMRQLSDLYEVVGIVEPDESRRERAKKSKTYQGLTWVTEDQLFDTKGLQAVAVETTIDELAPTGQRCVEAGYHIHLDKPAGPNLEDCQSLHAAAMKQGITVQMGYMLRYNPAFQFLFNALKEGWLGDITEVNGMMGKKASPGLRKELAAYPGGGMFELTCHLIDALVTVLGKPTKTTPYNRSTHPSDGFVDNQLAVFEYKNAVATLRSNHIDPQGGPRRQFNVTGTKGNLEIRPLEPPKLRLGLEKATGSYERGWQEISLEKTDGRYTEEFRDLAKVIHGEKKLAWDAQHDLAVQETVLRASGML